MSSQACATAVRMRVPVFPSGHGCAEPGPRPFPARSPRPEACECALPSRGVSEISEIRGSSAVPLSIPVRGVYKNVKIWEATLVSEGPRGALEQRIPFLTRPVPNKTAFPFLTKQVPVANKARSQQGPLLTKTGFPLPTMPVANKEPSHSMILVAEQDSRYQKQSPFPTMLVPNKARCQQNKISVANKTGFPLPTKPDFCG